MAHLDVAAKLSSNPGSQRLGVRGSAARPDFSEPRHDVPTPHGPQQRASLPSNCSVTNRGTLTARASPQAPSLIQLHHSSTSRSRPSRAHHHLDSAEHSRRRSWPRTSTTHYRTRRQQIRRSHRRPTHRASSTRTCRGAPAVRSRCPNVHESTKAATFA
jgi:hypothetical protein